MNYFLTLICIATTFPLWTSHASAAAAAATPSRSETDVKSVGGAAAGVPVASPAPGETRIYSDEKFMDLLRRSEKMQQELFANVEQLAHVSLAKHQTSLEKHQKSRSAEIVQALPQMPGKLTGIIGEYAQEQWCPDIDEILIAAIEPLKVQIAAELQLAEKIVTAMISENKQTFEAWQKLRRQKSTQWPHSSAERRRWETAGFSWRPMSLKRDRMVCEGCGAEVYGLLDRMEPVDYHDYTNPHTAAVIGMRPGGVPYNPPTPAQLASWKERALVGDQIKDCTRMPNPIVARDILRRVDLRAQQLWLSHFHSLAALEFSLRDRTDEERKQADAQARAKIFSSGVEMPRHREILHQATPFPRDLIPIVTDYVGNELLECAEAWFQLNNLVAQMRVWRDPATYIQNSREQPLSSVV